MKNKKEKILQDGELVLRQTAQTVDLKKIKTDDFLAIVEKMKKSLRESENGVAIAAPQIGVSLRLFLVAGELFLKDEDLEKALDEKKPEKKLPPAVFINPKITKISKKKNILSEGCLSVDGYYGTVERADKVTVEAYDENGKKFSRGASGLLAQAIQHETDHLNGTLFVDHAKNIKKIENKDEKSK